MKVKNEKQLATKKSSPKGGKKPITLKGLPDQSWTEKELIEGASYQWNEIQAAEKKAAVHVFRLGAALALLKPLMKKRRGWGKFIKGLHLSETTAWRAMELFTRAKTEDQVALLPITEAYEKFGIIVPPKVPADDDEAGDNNAAEKNGKMNAAAKNMKEKKTAPNFASVKDLKDEQEEAYEEVGQDEDDDLNPDHRTTKKQSDEYYTPDNAIALLLPYLPKGKVIGEVAWGQGHIARYLQSHGHTVVGGPDNNFLTDSIEAQIYVTNPPFSQKDDFLRRAYSLGKPFAMLLPADALVGLARYPLFATHGIQLLIPNKRIQYFDANGAETTCNFNSFWFCWNLLPQDVVFAELPPNGKGGAQ